MRWWDKAWSLGSFTCLALVNPLPPSQSFCRVLRSGEFLSPPFKVFPFLYLTSHVTLILLSRSRRIPLHVAVVHFSITLSSSRIHVTTDATGPTWCAILSGPLRRWLETAKRRARAAIEAHSLLERARGEASEARDAVSPLKNSTKAAGERARGKGEGEKEERRGREEREERQGREDEEEYEVSQHVPY